MAFSPDYPGAIIIPARNFGYGTPNHPKAWCLHTPEEPADDHMSTPYYLASTTREASVHYFVSFHGFVCQLVPESEGAYANAVEGKPYPVWADSKVNLNLQTLSIEIEGYAATIDQTMPQGSPQWKALAALIAHRCKTLNIPPGRTFAHKDVSIYRSDPGKLNIPLLVTDVIAAMKEEEMPLTEADRLEISNMIGAAVSGGGQGSLARVLEDQNAANYIRLKAALKAFVVNNAPSGGGIPPLKVRIPAVPAVDVPVVPQ